MGSKLGGVVLTVLVLALSFAPAAPVANVAVAQAPNVGMEYQPGTIAVAPESDFNVSVMLVDTVAQNISTWTIYSEFNTSMLTVNNIYKCKLLPTGNPPYNMPGYPKWNNTAGSAASGDPSAGWLDHQSGVDFGDPAVNTSFEMATVNFHAGTTEGSTTVCFMSVNPLYMAQALEPGGEGGNDRLNWTMIVNLTVTISNGATCCADINDNETSTREGGNVSIDAVMQTPPYPKCVQNGSLNHTFTVQAYPDAGWEFVNWTGNVNDTTANPATITINNGATDTITANFYHLPPEVCVDTNLLDFGGNWPCFPNPANKTFTVTNCGGHTLNWTSSLSYDPANPNTTYQWCSYSPTSGGPLSANQSDVIEVAIDIANLTEDGDVGRYNATINITGSSSEQVRVTFYLYPLPHPSSCRDIVLPHGDYVCPGESFAVWVDFEFHAGNWSNITLVDNTTVTNSNGDPFLWDSVVQIEEDPPASSKTVSGTGNTSVEYHWAGNYTPGTEFTVHYNVTVPASTPAGWYNMTVCPDNTTAWIEFYIDGIAYTHCIYCDYQIKVNKTTIEGTIYQANTSVLAGAYVVLKLGTSEVANTTSNATGCYNFTVNQTGDYTVNVTRGGFTYQQKWANVTALNETYTVDFKGMDAPYPTAPDGLYVLKCSNLWLYGAYYPPGFALNGKRLADVVYAWVHPS